jgi:hypothetical protein
MKRGRKFEIRMSAKYCVCGFTPFAYLFRIVIEQIDKRKDDTK